MKKILSTEKIMKDNIISEQKNIELYDRLTDKHLNKVFSKRPNPVGEKLAEWREKVCTTGYKRTNLYFDTNNSIVSIK